MLFARSTILQAARAAGIAAFDTVYSDAANEEGFIREAELIKQLGFDGKSLVNPRQIELLHNIFAPTLAQCEQAQKIIQAAAAAELEGSGVVSLNGKMVDSPVIARAELLLQRAALSGVREE
ncbi:Citrate lyase subunit beta [compost metagenome]